MAGRNPKNHGIDNTNKVLHQIDLTDWELRAKDCLIAWRNDIYLFAVQALGFKRNGFVRECDEDVIVSNQQVEFFTAINRISYIKRCLQQQHFPEGHKWIADECGKLGIITRAAKGTGKDFELAVLALWLLCCFDPIKIPCIAPTGSQLKTILWDEIRRWLSYSRCRVTDWYEVNEHDIYFRDPATGKRIATRRMFGRTALVTAEGESTTLSGLHAKHMVIFFDECSRIPDGVFDPLFNTCCDAYNWIVGMFNPEKLTGFAKESDIGKMKEYYYQLHQNFLDTDRLSEVEKANQIERLAKKYGGRNSNGFKVYVLGEYPTAEGDGFIPFNYAIDAMQRDTFYVTPGHPVRAGIDPGLLKDKTIVSLWQGPNQIGIEEVVEANHHNDEVLLCEYILNEIFVPKNVRVATIELDGIGHAVYTILKRLCVGKGIVIKGIVTRDSARNKKKYYSRKEELWDQFREMIVHGLVTLIEDDDQHAELIAMRKDENEERQGRLKLVSNRKVEKSIGRSPDKASALIMAIATDDRAFIPRPAIWDKYGISDESYGNRDKRNITYMGA